MTLNMAWILSYVAHYQYGITIKIKKVPSKRRGMDQGNEYPGAETGLLGGVTLGACK
jgi:hypothetical protein